MHRKSNTWVSDNCLTPNKKKFSNIMARTSYDDDCYIHKTNTLGNMTLILRQPVFDFTPYCCACDAANINFIVYSFTWTGLEPTIYHSKCEHATHYIINVIKRNEILYKSKINNDRQSLNSSSKLRMSWNRNSAWVGKCNADVYISHNLCEWMSDCCLTPSEKFFINILVRKIYHLMRRRKYLFCTRPSYSVGFL